MPDIWIGRSEEDRKKFGDKGLIFIGKQWVRMGHLVNLSNPIYLDIARSHVIMVCGKRGCLVGDTPILTSNGIKRIKDFNENKDFVVAFNKRKKIFEFEKAKLLKYPIFNEKLFRIELEDGRKLTLTKEHPLLTIKNNKLFWKKAEHFLEDDYLINQKKLEKIKIEKIKKVYGIKEVYDLFVSKNHSFIANGIISHNSGKSYTLGVIAESITDMPAEVKENIAPLIFDTMGIYWSMAYRNDKEIDLLRQWQLKPKNLPVKVFVPYAYYDEFLKRGIGKIEPFALAIPDVGYEDWLITFGLSYKDAVGITIQKAILKLQEKYKESNQQYDINDIIETIKADAEAEKSHKLAAINLFNAAKAWGIFATKQQEATTTRQLLKAGTTTVLDLSMYSSVGVFNVRALVIGLLCRKIFNERVLARKLEEVEAVRHGLEYLHFKEKRELPLVWIFIDEAHEFLPKQGKTAASDALIQLLREGRQPGISLVFATQQPGKLHSDAITQSDIIISHRLTAKPDLDALSEIMQSYLAKDILTYMNDLPKYKGSAIILDDNSERIYAIRVRPRFTWHGGEAPTAVKVLKRE